MGHFPLGMMTFTELGTTEISMGVWPTNSPSAFTARGSFVLTETLLLAAMRGMGGTSLPAPKTILAPLATKSRRSFPP